MKDKNTNPGNIASWKDPEAKSKSLTDGRSKLYKARRKEGESSFKEYHLKSLQIGKLRQYHNYLAIYLIENGISTENLMQSTKRLNTPNYYINNTRLTMAIERFVDDVNKVSLVAITFSTALELITKCLKIKETKFPLQKASITARLKKAEVKALNQDEVNTIDLKQQS